LNISDLNKALCRKRGMNTSLFFEDFEQMTPKKKFEIISICERCEVKNECREAGAAQKDGYGLWGGVFFKKGRILKTNSSRRTSPKASPNSVR